MKKIVVLIFLFLLLIGCSQRLSDMQLGNNQSDFSGLQSNEQSDYKKIDSITVYMDRNGQPYNQIESWELYFKKNTGIDVNILYIEDELKNNVDIFMANGAIYDAHPSRLVYSIINEKKLYSLNEYYEKYNWNQIIDQQYIDLVTLGGDILALPCISDPFVNPRFYNNDYLISVNLVVPENITEFTNFLIEAKKMEPTQYQMVINTSFATKQLADIFRAYNVYVSTYNNSMIGYNPKTNSFEDGVFSENFEEAYSFIAYLQSSKILLLEHQSVIGAPYLYDLATEYGAINNSGGLWKEELHMLPTFPYSKGYYLSGINNQQLVEVRSYNDYFYFPKTIQNIDGYMQEFDEVFTSTNHYFDVKYGMQGVDYDIQNGSIIKMTNESGNYLSLNTIESLDQTLLGVDNGLAYANSLPNEMIFSTNSLLDIIPVSYGIGYDTLRMPPTQFGSNYNSSIVTDLFSRNAHMASDSSLLSQEEVIANYKTQFKMADIASYIDGLNERIGATTKFRYWVSEDDD